MNSTASQRSLYPGMVDLTEKRAMALLLHVLRSHIVDHSHSHFIMCRQVLKRQLFLTLLSIGSYHGCNALALTGQSLPQAPRLHRHRLLKPQCRLLQIPRAQRTRAAVHIVPDPYATTVR